MAIVIRAREIITDKNNWCQSYYAYRHSPEPDYGDMAFSSLPARGALASIDLFMSCAKYCALGAIYKAGWELFGSDSEDESMLIASYRVQDMAGTSLWALNDRSSHEEVLRVFDKEIERWKEPELEL